MAFALGVAIAELFQRIADLLRMSWVPPPPGGGTGSEISPIPRDPDDAPYDPTTPTVPEPPTPPVPPDVVEVPPPEDGIPSPPVDENGCPIVAPSQLAFLESGIYTAFATVADAETRAAAAQQAALVDMTVALAQPTGHYLQSEDYFRFRALSTSTNVPVSFFGRIQYPTGGITPFNFVLNTTTANTVFQVVPQATAGVLLGCAASVPIGSITAGAVNAIGEIGRLQGGVFTPHTLLFSGQLDDLYPLTIGGGGLPIADSRPTFLGVDSLASVAPPVALTITPNAGKRFRIIRIYSDITTSAAGTERFMYVSISSGGVTWWRSAPAGVVGPNSATFLAGAMGGPGANASAPYDTAGSIQLMSLPETLYFYTAMTITVNVAQAQAADRLANTLVRYEES